MTPIDIYVAFFVGNPYKGGNSYCGTYASFDEAEKALKGNSRKRINWRHYNDEEWETSDYLIVKDVLKLELHTERQQDAEG